MKKKIAAAISLILLTSTLASCGATTKDIKLKEENMQVVLELGWWGNDPRHTYTIEAIEEFEELNPNIKVNLDYGEFSNYETRWNIKMKAGIEPDIMQVNYAWMKNMAKESDAFYPIDKLADTVDLSTYSEDSLSYGTVNGTLYALPIALNAKSFVYDKEVFKQYGLDIPKTWDDIFAAAEVLSKDGIYALDLEQSTAWFVIESYWEQTTGKEFATDGKLNLTQEDIEIMLDFYISLIEHKVTPDPSKHDANHFSDGTYAGSVLWVTDTARYEAMLPDGHTFVVGNYPVLSGATRTGKYIKPATMYAVSKNTKHPKEAAQLLDFLVNSEQMAMHQQVEKGVPVSSRQKSKLEKEGLLTGVLSEAEAHMGDQEIYLIDENFENSVIKDELKTATDSILYNGQSVENAAAVYYEKIMEAF